MGALFGKVRDNKTNNVIENVSVKFGAQERTTSPTGSYFFLQPDPISGPLTADIPGYEDFEIMVDSPAIGVPDLEINISLVKTEEVEEKPPEEIIDTETIKFWEDRGFTNAEAVVISNWVIQNKQDPTTETINQILIEAGLREPPVEPSLFDVLKSFFVADNWILAFEGFREIFEDTINPDSPGEELLAELVFTLIPAGKVAKGSFEISKFFKIREWFNVGKKFSTKNINPLEIERYLAAGKYTKLLEYARTEPKLFSSFLTQSSPEVKSLLLKGLRKQADPTAFNMAVQAIHKVEGAKGLSIFHLLIPIKEHPIKTAAAVVSAMSAGLGIDVWGNWALIDNLAFTLLQEAKAARNQFVAGEITREEAIKEVDRVIVLSELGADKVRISAKLNPIQILFLPLWDEVADENTNLIKIIRQDLEFAEPEKPKGRLVITPTPSDADVSVEGQFKVTGTFNKELDIGNYNWTVSKFGFVSKSGSVEIFEGETEEINVEIFEEVKPPIPPEEQKGNLIISVEPEDAIIEVSDQPEITSAGTYELFQGFYNIKVSKEGFETQLTTIFVRAQEDIRASFILKEIITPPEVSIIRVTSDPIESRIFIDAKDTFQSTDTSLQVDPGEHTLTLKKQGFLDKEIEFEIKEGESLLFNLILEEIPIQPEPEQALLKIGSNPGFADVYINGEYKFVVTPFTILLDAGSYIIRVQKEGFLAAEESIILSEGEEKELLLTLSEIPPDEIPIEPYNPYQPTLPLGFETLFPVVQTQRPLEILPVKVEKELLVNIETTDVKPWKGRIYSIASLDLSDPNAEIITQTSEDEGNLINEFITYFNSQDFKKLVGFKLTFDHRYIFNKLMLYRIKSKKWADIDLKDVKQLLDQVKEEFVYFPDKSGKLDDYGKELLGKGKYGSQKTMLKMFLAKNFDYVRAFQERQIEITRDLYDLFEFSASEGVPEPSLDTSHTTTSPETTIKPGIPINTTEKPCKNCLQLNPLDKTECIVCGDQI